MASCGYRNRPLRLPHALRYGELGDDPKPISIAMKEWLDAYNPKQVSVVSAREGDFGA